MPNTDLLKLIFHHDQRMEQLAPSKTNSDNMLAMFTKPDPTFSTLYFSGTVLEEQRFGLNQLEKSNEIISLIEKAFDTPLFTSNSISKGIAEALEAMDLNASIKIDPINTSIEIEDLSSGEVLRDELERGCIIIYKRAAKQGFDIQVYSKENIYLLFFYHLQAMLAPNFRFFSINGKRVHNEDFFYFETHRLNNPPHGFEEVFPESVL